MGKPGGGIWLEMESMPGFHCRQTLLHSIALGGVVVPVPPEGSLCGCSEEGSALCQSLGERAIAPLQEVWVWAVQRAIWESRHYPGMVMLHLV